MMKLLFLCVLILPSAAREFLDVSYLDDARDTVTYGEPKKPSLAYRCRLNFYLPAGEGPFPFIISVHGGGYTGGHSTQFSLWNGSGIKDTKVDPAEEGIRRGYIPVCLNYILGGSIHPQVQRDNKEAVRFLAQTGINSGCHDLLVYERPLCCHHIRSFLPPS